MKLKIVSFNIRCCDDPNGHSIADRAPRLKAVIDSTDADVIALQEYRPKWEDKIRNSFSDRYEIYDCYRSVEKPEGNVILWKKGRFSCLEKGLFWLSDTPERESLGWDEKYHCPRICSYAQLLDLESSECFLLMNTHFGFGDECHRKSIDLLVSYRNRYPRIKAVICGDFNMNAERKGYQQITQSFLDVNEETVKERRSSFHNYEPEVPRKMHIDFFFVDPSVKPESFRLLDQAFDGKYPSDHFGIFTELSL